MARKRINISVDEQTYEELQRIRRSYGFKNLCEFSVAMLHVVAQYIQAAEARRGTREDVDAVSIMNMFNEMGAWERTPDGIVPVRHHHKEIEED